MSINAVSTGLYFYQGFREMGLDHFTKVIEIDNMTSIGIAIMIGEKYKKIKAIGDKIIKSDTEYKDIYFINILSQRLKNKGFHKFFLALFRALIANSQFC